MDAKITDVSYPTLYWDLEITFFPTFQNATQLYRLGATLQDAHMKLVDQLQSESNKVKNYYHNVPMYNVCVLCWAAPFDLVALFSLCRGFKRYLR